MPAMAGAARSLAATGHAGRRSGRGGVPTLERGNEQRPSLMGSRRGKSPDQGIDIPFLSRAWPTPTTAAVFVGRSGPCPRWQEGNGRGGHRLRRTPERPGLRSRAETWEQSNVVASGFPVTRWKAGPARRTVRGRTGIRGSKQSFGAEPVGGVRNREKGANCLSAASFCPAGSAARRPGSSQRQGCPFFWFFSLGRQRKERHPARGRRHSGDAGTCGRKMPAMC